MMVCFQIFLLIFLIYYIRIGECRLKNETIDVFMLYKSPSENSSYHDSGSDFMTMKLLSKTGENVRFHLVGHIDRMKRFTKNHGLAEVFYHDFFAYPESLAEFKASYKHQSVNKREYEFMCFYRWIIYANIVKTYKHLNFSTIVALDTDVLVYKSLSSILDDVMRQKGHVEIKEMYMLVTGAFLFWQVDGLLKFSSYLVQIFKMNRHKLIKFIQDHGTYISAKRPADLIPYDSKTQLYTHFSDMYALLAFLSEDTSNRFEVTHQNLTCKILPQSRQVSKISIINGFPFTANNECISTIHLQGDHKVYTSILFDSSKGKLTIDIYFQK